VPQGDWFVPGPFAIYRALRHQFALLADLFLSPLVAPGRPWKETLMQKSSRRRAGAALWRAAEAGVQNLRLAKVKNTGVGNQRLARSEAVKLSQNV